MSDAAMPIGGESVSVGDKKLYMFSDIEGCQNDTKDQSISCSL